MSLLCAQQRPQLSFNYMHQFHRAATPDVELNCLTTTLLVHVCLKHLWEACTCMPCLGLCIAEAGWLESSVGSQSTKELNQDMPYLVPGMQLTTRSSQSRVIACASAMCLRCSVYMPSMCPFWFTSQLETALIWLYAKVAQTAYSSTPIETCCSR